MMTANPEKPSRGVYWDVLRPRLISACAHVSAWGYGVAPRVVRASQQVCYDAYDALTRGLYARPLVVRLRVNDVAFSLFIVADHPTAQREYQRMSVTGDVYEPVMVECLTRILSGSPAAVFMDVGAFMGYYAAYVSALGVDSRPVHAVESNPRYVAGIRESARLNQFRNLHVYEAALSDISATVGVEGETVLADGPGSLQVTSVALDDLCRREAIAPTVVKIDVHGAEGKVIRGMRSLLATTVEYLLLEVHPIDFLQRYSPGVRRTEVLDILEDAGLNVYFVSGHRAKRSDGLRTFLETGSISYRRLDRASRDLLLFDRHVDIFLLAMRRNDIESLLGPSAGAED